MVPLVLHAVPGLAPRQLVVFRARSRHTYGFDTSAPSTFDLPQIELSSVLGAPALSLTAVDPSADGEGAQSFWVDGVSQSELRRAAERCILVHGAYAIVSSADSVASARDGLRGYGLPAIGAVAVIDLAQANLRRNERAELQAQLHAASCTCTDTQGVQQADPLPSSTGERRAWVLIREIGGAIHLGWRVAVGPAAGLGAPGQASGRRCYSGWLGKYALKNREFAAPTAMEPEIAFLSRRGWS